VRASLSQAGVDLQERDFFQDRFSEEELRRLLGDRPPSAFFSWKSPSFRALGRPPESFTEDELLRLMLDEPRLIRRPLIQVGDRIIVGVDKRALEELTG
jgi:arsenate reductase-like glutaredoxin family protein